MKYKYEQEQLSRIKILAISFSPFDVFIKIIEDAEIAAIKHAILSKISVFCY